MKFLHTSDWHLGIDLHKHSLLKDQQYFIDQLCDIVIQEDIDVVLISGDIYDTTLASKEAISLFDDAMRRLCMDLKRKVVVIAGNHDSQTRLSVMKDLLKEAGLYIFGQLDTKISPICFGDVDVFPLPYIHKDRISALYDQAFVSYEQAYLCVMDDIRRQKQHHKQVVMAHAFVAQAQLSESDRFAMVGGSDLVSKEVFHDIDYVALGHLHKPQKLSENIVYSGSPIAYAFSEKEAKHVVIWDSETGTQTQVPIKALHPLITLEGTYEQVKEQLLHVQDAYVKIILQDRSVTYELLHLLREGCPYLLSLQGKEEKELTEATTLNVAQLDQLQDEEIVSQFFQDYYDREISEEESMWLKEAKEGTLVCG